MKIFMKLVLITIITAACGAEQKEEEAKSLLMSMPHEECNISSGDGAYRSGYFNTQKICSRGVYGSLETLCSPQLQVECIFGAKAYLQFSHCNFRESLRSHDALMRLCPLHPN